MNHPPSPTKGKVAGPGQIAATLLNDPNTIGVEMPNGIATTGYLPAHTALKRLLVARLDKLGLSHSGVDDDGDSILIGGQAHTLRTASAMARQLGALS
jgi:hypothetical protein